MKDWLELNWFSLCILRFFFLVLSFLKIIIFQISSKLLISLFVGSALFLDLPSLCQAISCRLGPDKRKRLDCGLKELKPRLSRGRIPSLSGLLGWLPAAHLTEMESELSVYIIN